MKNTGCRFLVIFLMWSFASLGELSASEALLVKKRLAKPLHANELLIFLLDGGNVIPANKLVKLVVKIDGAKSFEIQKFKISMPKHGHGMLLEPKWTKRDDRSVVIEGVKLHMSGEWEFEVEFEVDNRPAKLNIPYTVK